jgi:carbonic anhydrase
MRCMTQLATLLERNRVFAAAGGHEGAVVVPRLMVAVVTCLDPRVDPAHVLGLELSEAIVIRNVGGRVTNEVVDDLAFLGVLSDTLRLDDGGPLFEIAVLHHTQCGAGALADDGFRRRYAERIGAPDPDALRAGAVVDPEATVAADLARLRAAPQLRGRHPLSGHVYDVTTGLVRTVADESAAVAPSQEA